MGAVGVTDLRAGERVLVSLPVGDRAFVVERRLTGARWRLRIRGGGAQVDLREAVAANSLVLVAGAPYRVQGATVSSLKVRPQAGAGMGVGMIAGQAAVVARNGWTDRERIEAAAMDVIHGRLHTTSEPGMCLAFARQVIEAAMGWPSHALYDQGPHAAVTSWVMPAAYDHASGHVARDAEHDLRRLGMTLQGDRPRGGDLAFDYEAAWDPSLRAHYGHVGILLGEDEILEVVDPAYRPLAFVRGAGLCWGVRQWRPTSIMRFDSSKIPA